MNANESLSRVGPVLRTRGLEKEYGRGEGLVRALDGVELEVASGETLAVMGPSGCGKSTLLHLLGGLERPSAGEVWLAGRRIDELSEKALARLRRHATGFVFQAFHLMDELTAVENVEVPALLAGRSPRAARRRATKLLEQVGLANRAKHLPVRIGRLAPGCDQRHRHARGRRDVVDSSSPSEGLRSRCEWAFLRLVVAQTGHNGSLRVARLASQA
jgi:putative ABC transport system ATP-binding protein